MRQILIKKMTHFSASLAKHDRAMDGAFMTDAKDNILQGSPAMGDMVSVCEYALLRSS